MTAYEFHLRGLEYHRLGGVLDENLREATRWFERAIKADANFARHRAMWVCASSGLPEFDEADGERRTQRALELDPNDPEANRVMGSILMHRGAFDASREYHEKAMALSPSDAYIKGRSAAFYNFAGEPERALKLLDEAAELDPFLHVWCVEERVAVLYNLGRFREAIEAALRLTFQTRRSRLYRAAAHAALGETERAGDVVAGAIASGPESGHRETFGRGPLYSQKRTFGGRTRMSALCQKRTFVRHRPGSGVLQPHGRRQFVR
jgi:adenylate cyclase